MQKKKIFGDVLYCPQMSSNTVLSTRHTACCSCVYIKLHLIDILYAVYLFYKGQIFKSGSKLELQCARTQLGGVHLQMESDDGWRGAAKLGDWCQLIVVQSPEGQTQEDGLITRRNEGQGSSSEAYREKKSMCSSVYDWL